MNNQETTQNKKRGCFFYGCLTIVILAILAAGGLYFGARYVVKTALEKYTDTRPVALAKTTISTADLARLQARLDQFKSALDNQKALEPLVLSGEEINALIAQEPKLRPFQDQFLITVAGDQIKAQISLPVEKLGLRSYQGRYLNGSAALRGSLQNGVFVLNLQSLEIKGQSLPPEAMTIVSRQNLAEDLAQDPKTAALLQKLESIQVTDGQVVIKPKVKPGG